MMKTKKSVGLTIVALVVAFLFFVPIYWMLIVALKPEGNSAITIMEWFNFSNLTLYNFEKVLVQSKILSWTLNSLIVALATMVLSVLICSLAAFSFSKLKFRSKGFFYVFITLGLLIPTEAIIIPLYNVSIKLNTIDSLWGIILPGLTNPLGVILLKQFMDGIPNDYIEAAELEGAGKFRVWFAICLPMTRTAMVAVGIFNFLLAWNSFLWPFISITSPDKMMLATGLPTFLSNNNHVLNTIMAASAVAAIPAMVMFILLQKQIIEGVSLSGVKG